jgi:hypothetical protein
MREDGKKKKLMDMELLYTIMETYLKVSLKILK